MNDVEVDEEPDPGTAELQVRVKLGVMDGVDALDSLQLYDHFTFDEEIQAETSVQKHSVIRDRELDIRFEADAALAELVGETNLIYALE
jgi:hypothetical protein